MGPRGRGVREGATGLDEAAALLLLARLPGVGDRTVLALRDRFGSGRAALSAPATRFRALAGKEAAAARADPALRGRVEEGVRRAIRLGARLAVHGGPGYPPALHDLADPPPVLFLLGDRELLDGAGVGVVGSRKATAYGRRIARSLGAALARAGAVVVSGLALGVDGEAHRGALAGGGRTLAVLGSGLERPHPPSHRRLFRTLAEEHLLVSEFLPDEPPLPHHFPKRNRVLAALCRAVIVVEAARRSGALITADHAGDLGRDVLAVPGPVDSPTSRGANALLRDGAGVIVDPSAPRGFLPWLDPPGGAREAPAPRPDPVLGEDALAVWASLEPRPATLEEIGRRARLSPRRLLAALSLLEVEGWAVQQPGMSYTRGGGE